MRIFQKRPVPEKKQFVVWPKDKTERIIAIAIARRQKGIHTHDEAILIRALSPGDIKQLAELARIKKVPPQRLSLIVGRARRVEDIYRKLEEL